MPDENERQYIWRLAQAKDDGLLNMSWDELGEVFNKNLRTDDEWYDQSAYRKPYQYAKAFYEDVFSKTMTDSDSVSEDYTFRKRELEKEKKKLQTEKIEYNRWLRQEARDELIVEKIEKAIETLEPIQCTLEPLDEPESEKSWLLAFGDAHFGAEFAIKGLNGEVLNEYNPEVFYSRMEKLAAKIIDIVSKENISTLYIWDLADQVDGILRVSQLMQLRYGVIDSAIKYAQAISIWLARISMFCNIKYAQASKGNHCQLRMLGAPKGTFEEEDMGKVIWAFIKAQHSENKRIEFIENETDMIFQNIQGCNVIGYHGEDKDLERAQKDYSQMYNVPINLIISGHLHHAYSENIAINCDVMRIPSIIGIDDYSMKLHKTSNPGATMICIQRGKGKVLEYNLKL